MPATVIAIPEVREVGGKKQVRRASKASMGRIEWVDVGRDDGDIKAWGEVEVRNGPGKCHVEDCGCSDFHFIARNKIVQNGIWHITNMIPCSGVGIVNLANSNSGVQVAAPFATNDQTRSKCMVGSSVGATTYGHSALGTPIAVNPNMTSFNLAVIVANTTLRWSFSSTWNSGTITGTVNEIGVFGNLTTSFAQAINGGAGGGDNLVDLALFARLCVTDSEFASFAINTAFPLVVEYRFTVSF